MKRRFFKRGESVCGVHSLLEYFNNFFVKLWYDNNPNKLHCKYLIIWIFILSNVSWTNQKSIYCMFQVCELFEFCSKLVPRHIETQKELSELSVDSKMRIKGEWVVDLVYAGKSKQKKENYKYIRQHQTFHIDLSLISKFCSFLLFSPPNKEKDNYKLGNLFTIIWVSVVRTCLLHSSQRGKILFFTRRSKLTNSLSHKKSSRGKQKTLTRWHGTHVVTM